MNKFPNTRLWNILDNPASGYKGKHDFTGLVDEFVDELHIYCRKERNIAERTRSLNYLRNKLSALYECFRIDAKRNVPLLKTIHEAINFVNDELNLVHMDLDHPERFIEFPSENPPLARWNGKIVELIEYFLPLQIDGKLLLPSGEVMTYADLIRYLESSLGITVAESQRRKYEVVNRSKPTVFIEKMLEVLRNAIKKSHQ